MWFENVYKLHNKGYFETSEECILTHTSLIQGSNTNVHVVYLNQSQQRVCPDALKEANFLG